MAIQRRVNAIFLYTFSCSLLATFTATLSTDTDIACLKSIKQSLDDPFGYLRSSWNFNNKTEGYICRFSGVDCWHPDENKILNLKLSGMGLRGQFPLGIQNCTSLTGLDLSNNELQGSIPSNISKIVGFLTSLDLSSNNFSGEIPVGIANCSYLSVLKLDNNHLIGPIPPLIGLLDRIKIFSVASNMLSGQVPNFTNASISADSYADNSGLCGGPLESCGDTEHRPDYSFKSGFWIGYLVSAVIVVVAYASYCVPWVHVGKKNKMITVAAMIMLMIRRKKKKTEVDPLGGLSTVQFLLDMQISTSEKNVTRMNFVDLYNATNKFSQHNIIGLGDMGTLYKATLPNGWSLAVKRLSNHQQFEEQFMSEIKTLGRLRHHNLLPLLGFCMDSKESFLVYQYMSNGNLFDWLHSMEDNGKKALEWPLRVKIAAGLAKGLAWLHHGCDLRVAHLSISSKCVLLDQNFEPKLSNFGTATFINPNEINLSWSFSMDIEFWEQCCLKEDVFKFGIVLLELITGIKNDSLHHSDGILDKWLSEFSSSSFSMLSAIDNTLVARGHDGEIFQLLNVAYNCVQAQPEQRPSMLDVLETVSRIRAKYEPPTSDLEQSARIGVGASNSEDEYVDIEIREIH